MLDTNSFTLVSWKSRTSELDEQTFLEHRRPRNDRQPLRTLLSESDAVLVDYPEADVHHEAPIEVVLLKFQHLPAVALVMLGAAHLLVLKRFSSKFLKLAVMKPRDTHLRAPSLAEILDADHAAWSAAAELLSESKGSLNDVLNEVAFCRQVFHTSLARRPQPLQPTKPDPPKRKPDLPKPDPKKPKPASPRPQPSKDKPDASKKSKWDQSWAKKLPNGTGISGTIWDRAGRARHVDTRTNVRSRNQMESPVLDSKWPCNTIQLPTDQVQSRRTYNCPSHCHHQPYLQRMCIS